MWGDQLTHPTLGIPGLTEEHKEILLKAGIRTVKTLLYSLKGIKQRKQFEIRYGLPIKDSLYYVNAADLLRIPGLGTTYIKLLNQAEVASVKELSYRNPEVLWEMLCNVNDTMNITQVTPSLNWVQQWIDCAKRLDKLITYR